MGRGWDYTCDKPLDHAVILVSVEGSTYLVDNGFGFRSLRFPIPVSFSEDVEEAEVQKGEKY